MWATREPRQTSTPGPSAWLEANLCFQVQSEVWPDGGSQQGWCRRKPAPMGSLGADRTGQPRAGHPARQSLVRVSLSKQSHGEGPLASWVDAWESCTRGWALGQSAHSLAGEGEALRTLLPTCAPHTLQGRQTSFPQPLTPAVWLVQGRWVTGPKTLSGLPLETRPTKGVPQAQLLGARGLV